MKELFKHKEVWTLSFFLSVLGISLFLNQNCAPANFSRPQVSQGPGAGSICPDPSNPNCIDPIPPDCDGFGIVDIPKITLPYEQPNIDVNFHGYLGDARGPLQWNIIKDNVSLGKKIGLDVTYNLTPGEHLVKGLSGDNNCEDYFQLVVERAQCTNDVLNTWALNFVSPEADWLTNRPINMQITQYSELTNVEVGTLKGATSCEEVTNWAPLTSGDFSRTFDSAGTYLVCARAKDKKCGEMRGRSRSIVIRDPRCEPVTTAIAANMVTTDPRVGTDVVFNVMNYADLLNGEVYVDWNDGSAPERFTTNPIAHRYSAAHANMDKAVTFRAKSKGQYSNCQIDLMKTFNFRLKPACDAFPPVMVTVDPGQNIYTTTPVKFTVGNAAAYADPRIVVKWSLGNGSSGQGTNIPSPQYYSLAPNEYDTGATRTALFYVEALQPSPTLCLPDQTMIRMNVSIDRKTQTFKVGEEESRPPVKMFFVVDNSRTMLDDQTKLRNGFAAMFSDANLTNLKQFDSTVAVLSTAQKSYIKNSTNNTAISQLPSTTPEHCAINTTYNNLFGPNQYIPGEACPGWARRSSTGSNNLYPSLPGQVAGIRKQFSSGGNLVDYFLAPFPRFSPGSGGADTKPTNVQITSSLSKNPTTAQVTSFVDDFKDRVAGLNPNYYDDVKWDPYTQTESGLCAVARVLNEGTLFSPQDQLSFIIVSDENEQDPNGISCLRSSGAQSMDYGSCFPIGARVYYEGPRLCRLYYPDDLRISYAVRSFYVGVRRCEQFDDNQQCIRYGYTYTQYEADNFAYATCAEYLAAHPDNSCSETQKGKSINLAVPASPPSPTNGSCDGLPIPAGDVAILVPNSCSSYYASSGNGYIVDPASGRSCDSYLPAYCGLGLNYISCSSYEYRDQESLDLPGYAGTGLSCDSQCPVSSVCGNQTIQEWVYNETGRSCQSVDSGIALVSNPIPDNLSFPTSTPYNQRCPSGQQWATSRTQNVTTDVYVAGSRGTPLSTYIKNRAQEIQASTGLRPTFTTFVHPNNPGSAHPGESIGTLYRQLVVDLGMPSMNFDIDDTAYDRPLQMLTEFVQNLLKTVWDFIVDPGMQVRKISWKRGAAAPVKVINDTCRYVVDAKKLRCETTITVEGGTQVQLQNNDEIIVEYW